MTSISSRDISSETRSKERHMVVVADMPSGMDQGSVIGVKWRNLRISKNQGFRRMPMGCPADDMPRMPTGMAGWLDGLDGMNG